MMPPAAPPRRSRDTSPPHSWTPVFVLPNLNLGGPIEADLAAIVPASDPRVVAVGRDHPRLRKFLRFRDAFGQRFRPAVLIMREDAPARFFDVSAVAGLRDAIAISAIALDLSPYSSSRFW
jgi:hypothetical protein